MTDATDKPRREIVARRTLMLGTLAAAVTGAAATAAPILPQDGHAPGHMLLAAGEGEGEGEGEGGEGAVLDPTATLMRDLGFMQGHLRAGLVLYEAGDMDAARTHMGHPIKEKYDAVAAPLAERGLDRLKAEITALADAAEAGAPMAEISQLYDRVAATIDEARAGAPVAHRIAGLIALTRVAGDEYTVATEGGKLANLHEYQDSWGFLQVVRDRLSGMTGDSDADVAKAAQKMLDAVKGTDAVYGDLQGQGDFEMDPGVIFGAAARMEFAAVRLK